MRPTVSQYAVALEELSHEAKGEIKTLSQNFFAYLKRRGETKKAALILKQLEAREQVSKEELVVTAVTAREATSAMKKTLEEKAAEIFPKHTLHFEYQVDPSVIGGVRFRTSEQLYDATLQASLRALKQAMSK